MNLDPLASRLASQGVAYAPQIAYAAKRHHVDPYLLAAVAAQETGGPGSNAGRNVVGDGGHGHGVFQIDDRWHAFAKTPSAMDPAQNADYAAGMLSGLLRRYRGDARAALSAYNAGSPTAEGTRTTWRDGTTLGYADSVLRHYEALSGCRADAAADAPEAMASISALGNLAQMLPMPPPPSHARPYQHQATDYGSLILGESD